MGACKAFFIVDSVVVHYDASFLRYIVSRNFELWLTFYAVPAGVAIR